MADFIKLVTDLVAHGAYAFLDVSVNVDTNSQLPEIGASYVDSRLERDINNFLC